MPIPVGLSDSLNNPVVRPVAEVADATIPVPVVEAEVPTTPTVAPVVAIALPTTPFAPAVLEAVDPMIPFVAPVAALLMPLIAGCVVLVVTTCNLAVGVAVPTPTFVPAWEMDEFPSEVVPVHTGIAFFVPDPVT
jgi:hypothetical protein